MRKRIFVYLIAFSCFFFIVPSSQAGEKSDSAGKKITMACVRSEDSYYGKFVKLVFTEAFKRTGRELVYKFYPAKRASYMTDKGLADGDLARVYNYNEKYPNLIRVEEPVFSIRISAFSIDRNIKLHGWDSLRGTDYKVEYMLGSKICEEKLSEVVAEENLSYIPRWSQGLKKLIKGRTDIYVEVEGTVLEALKTDEFRNSGIQIAGVMEEQTIHAFLNKKHESLALELSAVLKEMKNEGLFDKYRNFAGD